MNGLMKCPESNLLLPTKFVDEKQALKKVIDDWLENAINSLSHVRDNYFLMFNAKFDKTDSTSFNVNAPVATYKLPPFMSNQLVWWVSPKRGICELLWMVAPKKKGEKLKVEFNKEGVAYLQAKGAMPSA
jgi:hypothetical protein